MIVCDDQDRFSRFHPQKFCWVMQELEEAGVRVETVSGGVIDTANFTDFLLAQIRQHQASGEAPKIGERVLKEWLRRARLGLDIGGHVPYGYNRDWTEHPERAKVVRWLFESYATRDTSLKALSNDLHARGAPSPSGKERWSPSTLYELLMNRAYIGEYVRFKESKSKWAFLTGGSVRVASRRRKRQPNPAAEWVVIKSHHGPLIAEELYARVQARLRGNQRHTAPKAGGTEHLLGRRLLACGRCGSWMTGTTWKVRGAR